MNAALEVTSDMILHPIRSAAMIINYKNQQRLPQNRHREVTERVRSKNNVIDLKGQYH